MLRQLAETAKDKINILRKVDDELIELCAVVDGQDLEAFISDEVKKNLNDIAFRVEELTTPVK